MFVVAVIGSGFMGHGIAQACAQAGCEVRLVDSVEAALAGARRRIAVNLATLVGAGELSRENAEALERRIATTTDYRDGTRDAALMIEAVPEDLALKRAVFARLEEAAPPDAILATNTASLRVSEIAMALRAPARVIGTHWFFPPYLVPLVEVVAGDETAPDVIARTRELLSRVGKVPIVCRDVPGFVVVRLLHALLNEAVSLLESGVASARDIDNAFRLGGGMGFFLYGPLLAHDLTVNKKTTLAVRRRCGQPTLGGRGLGRWLGLATATLGEARQRWVVPRAAR